MASDIVAVPADSGYLDTAGAPGWSLSPARGAVQLAGGMDYVDPEAPVLCNQLTNAGKPCTAYAGDDGWCVGHRRVLGG